MIRSIRFAAFALAGLALFTCGDAVAAGTTMAADAFDSLYETVRYWTQGSLGKTISLCFLIIGLGLGVDSFVSFPSLGYLSIFLLFSVEKTPPFMLRCPTALGILKLDLPKTTTRSSIPLAEARTSLSFTVPL